MEDETKSTIELNDAQVKVLEWIKSGYPDGVFPEDTFAHRISARTLHSRGLVRVSGHGKSWNAELTERGQQWPAATAQDVDSRRIRAKASSSPALSDQANPPAAVKPPRKPRSTLSASALAARDLLAAEELIRRVLETGGQKLLSSDLDLGPIKLQRILAQALKASSRPRGKKLADGSMRYDIPGVADEWMESAPEAHLKYVNSVNNKTGVKKAAKKLARLAKAWKYECSVPISSFYIEMRAAQYMDSETCFVADIDMKRFLESLLSHDLSAMNDPTGSTGRIKPCSSTANHADALSKLRTAVSRAQKAVACRESDPRTAFGWWDYVFGGKFPAYYWSSLCQRFLGAFARISTPPRYNALSTDPCES